MRGKSLVSALFLPFALAACEGTTTPAPEGRSTVAVAVEGDGDENSKVTAPANGASLYRGGGEVQGEVNVQARVWVHSETEGWIELTQQGAAEQTVDASSEGEAETLTTAEIRSGSYNRVRVEFERVAANLTAGLQIGGGSLLGAVQVNLGSDGTTTVEREVEFTAESDSSTQLHIDLNVDEWMQSADAESKTVAEATFSSAVQVTAR